MGKFYEKSSADNCTKIGKTQKDYLDDIKRYSGRYIIINAGIISQFLDYGTSFYSNELFFTSAKDTGGIVNKKHKLTYQLFTNLYSAKVSDNGNFETPENFFSSVSSIYHESTPVFTQDGNKMYFIRNNFNN
jgi:hypothetical protein